jgi:ABC-type multidrug transport system fused ATPase/permease subunit
VGVSLLVTLYYLDLLYTVTEKTSAAVDRRLMTLVAEAPTLTHHEHPNFLRELDLLREEQGAIAWVTNAIAGLVRVAVGLGASLVLLAYLDPILLVLPLLGSVSFWTGRQARRLHERAAEVTVEPERLRQHLFNLATSASPGKEVRVFDLAGPLLHRHHAAAATVLRARNRADWQAVWWDLATAPLITVGYVGALGIVLLRALSGLLTPGDVVLTLGLAAGLSSITEAAAAYGTRLLSILQIAQRYLWLEDYAARERPTLLDPATIPLRLGRGIELQNLSFHYPGSTTPILSDVSLRLPAGMVVALVGENGAGKTTLVKLLCRFYEPDRGRILVDDVDLRRLPIDRWRERVSLAFQDYQPFEFLLRETVGVGEMARIADQAAVRTALEKAGADDVSTFLPEGLETQLGRAWDDGVDLSVGQWQKLALARAMMRQDPLLVVFDEPTAALDAPTEHALFERVANAARASASAGWVTLLVTHRFSTVRVADLIVVLDGGRIVEIGDHQQLVAAGGLYAELYELQARTYR